MCCGALWLLCLPHKALHHSDGSRLSQYYEDEERSRRSEENADKEHSQNADRENRASTDTVAVDDASAYPRDA